MPYVGAELNHYEDERDSLIRYPLFLMRKRPIYTRRMERLRLTFGRKKNKGKEQ